MSQEIFLLGVRAVAFVVVAALVWLALSILRDLLAQNDATRPKDRHAVRRGSPSVPRASSDRGNGAVKNAEKWRFVPAFLTRRGASPSENAGSDAPSADLPLTIMAPSGCFFGSEEIDDLLCTFGLRLSSAGEYELRNENGRDVLFTMRAVHRRGAFLAASEEGRTIDGLLLVMQLPSGQDAVKSYETFSALAREMAEACGGRLCDFLQRPMERKNLMQYHAAARQFQHEYDAWLLRRQDES